MTWTSWSSATERQLSIAAGVVPQSSCSLSAQAPASIISTSAAGQRGVALAGEAEIDREGVEGAQHHLDVPRARRAGRRLGAVGRAGAAAEHRRDARHQGVVDLLRADEMDVQVEAAGGEDLALARDHLRARPDDDVDVRLDVRVAGLADPRDAPALQADIGLHDAPVIEDQRVGDDRVDGALGVRRPATAPCRRG